MAAGFGVVGVVAVVSDLGSILSAGFDVCVVLVLVLVSVLVAVEVVMVVVVVVVCRRKALKAQIRSNSGPCVTLCLCSDLRCAHLLLTGRRSQTRRWTAAEVAAPPTGRPRSWRRRRAAWRTDTQHQAHSLRCSLRLDSAARAGFHPLAYRQRRIGQRLRDKSAEPPPKQRAGPGGRTRTRTARKTAIR